MAAHTTPASTVEHFGTTDFVLYFDTEREEDPIDAFVRARLLAERW
jgi:hypothetical protein